MAKLAYDYTHAELVDAFWRTVAKAGVSNSGLAIDIMAGHDRAEASYLRGVLLSRLELQERPFTRGDYVRLSKSDSRCIVSSVNPYGDYYTHGRAEPGKRRMWWPEPSTRVLASGHFASRDPLMIGRIATPPSTSRRSKRPRSAHLPPYNAAGAPESSGAAFRPRRFLLLKYPRQFYTFTFTEQFHRIVLLLHITL